MVDRHKEIRQGSHVDVYLMGHPDRKFNGGFGVFPEDGAVASGLPNIERRLNWVHLSTRFLCVFVSMILTPPFSMGETQLL